MRTRTILIGALLLASAGVARAQDQQQPTPAQTTAQAQTMATPAASFVPKLGRIDFGYRGENLDGDEARYYRYRDLRDGAYVSRLFLSKETDTTAFFAEANNIGYRDQRYVGGFQAIGKFRADFEWNQVPLFLTKETRSLYREAGTGYMAIDDSVQAALQAAGNVAAVRDPLLRSFLSSAGTVDLRSRRDIANFNAVYTVNRDVDFKFTLRNTNRTGNQVMAFGFGTSPGLNPSVEFGVPVDDRTTDVKGVLEFANTKGVFSVGYQGSWYDNTIPFVRFDNPLRATDISGGASVGQLAWWPGNSAFSVNVNGSYKLPARTRASAAISMGQWEQDEQLPAPTVNTALVSPTLERTSAQTKADITSMVFGLNSRPVRNVYLSARYRYYDYDNKTPHFTVENAVIGDWSVTTQVHEIEPSSFQRKTLDLDASMSPSKWVSFGVGYGREDADRTWRIFEKTAEDVFRATVDSLGSQYFTVRLKYEFASRTGSGFDGHLLDEVGEQPGMRHYDIADRDRTRFTTILTVTPVAYLNLNAAVGMGNDDYTDTGFGLRDNDNTNWSTGFDIVPNDKVAFAMSYGFEKLTANQYSRTALPAGNASGPEEFFDERRDWWIDSDDKVRTVTADLDLTRLFPKTDVRLGYDLSDGEATYVYGTRPDAPRVSIPRVSSAVPVPVQLPELNNRLSIGRFDVQHFVRPNVALGVGYHYEQYKVEDFALGEGTIDQLDPRNGSTGVFASTIYAGYLFRPYTAHTWWLRMSYLW